MTYRDYEPEISPPWLRGRYGEAWAHVLGLAKDAIAEGAHQAVKLRLLGGCPEDALPYAGEDRQIERVPGESASSYRNRLLRAFVTWRLAGTNKGVLSALATIGFTSAIIIESEDWGASPDPTAWWLFWVVLSPPLPFSPAFKLGDGTKLGEKPLGVTGPLELIELLRRVIRKWKAAHAVCANVVLLFDGELLGTGWKLGDGTKLGGKAAFLAL